MGSANVDTTFLIVGAGPAGASLAAFLGQHGEPAPNSVQAIY